MSDIVGKVVTGYQGWFTCPNDGAPINGWWHWAADWAKPMSATNNGIQSWPDVRAYSKLHTTAFKPCANGEPAQLFSSYDQSTVDAHFKMMADAAIDTAALQRFNPTGGEGPIRNDMTVKVCAAAEKNGRKWYIMYDVSGWNAMRTELPDDWTTKMKAYSTTPGYAKHNGKPVVCIWGFGFNDCNHDFAPADCIEVIDWLKCQGCYVVGGVPTWWRRGDGDSHNNFAQVYASFDMLSPWMVGRASKLADLDGMYADALVPDVAECSRLGVAYQPCCLPGDLSAGDRRHGDFYWRDWYNITRATSDSVYISMFDEYNEGNQIAPTAESQAFQPTDFAKRALDEDGVACTGDYYLRVTKDAGAMWKAKTPKPLRPTEPWPGKGPQNKPRTCGITSLHNGKHLCAEGGGGQLIGASRTARGPWETFTIEYAPGGLDSNGNERICIKACNGKYLSCDPANIPSLALAPNKATAGPWEIFSMEPRGGNFALKGNNGKYAQTTGDSNPIIVNTDAAGQWESFMIQDA